MAKNYERGLLTAVLIWLCLLASSHAQTPLPPAKSCFESSGVVLNGGKVFTYAKGTTTPLASYTDYTLGTPNANPVILGSDGCANIWLGASAYKIAVQKSDGTVVYTTDGVAGGYNTFLALNGSNALTAISDPAASLGLFWLSSTNAGFLKWSDASAIHTVVGADSVQTLTNKTLASPTITGTPTGAGIPTITLKKGDGLGNKTTASTSFVDVDATNLAYTVTIPVGWKLSVVSMPSMLSVTGAQDVEAAIFDGAVIAEAHVNANTSVGGTAGLATVINGDGASHTIKLQYKTLNATNSALILNSSATTAPTMIFTLSASN